MTKFEKETLIEIMLYILNKTGGTDIYHVLKIIYFAEQKHLLEWGSRMTADDFRAYQYGPVPDQLYKAAHNNGKYGNELPVLFSGAACFAGDDAPNILLPKREPDMDYLPKAVVRCLDESIAENAGLTFGQLKSKSHDSAWRKAWNSNREGNDDLMDTLSIAEAAGANEDMLDYIKEQLDFDLALA